MRMISAAEELLIKDAIGEGVTNLPGAVIEKDLILSRVLDIAQSIRMDGATLVFCGGTCLSKAHGIIQSPG